MDGTAEKGSKSNDSRSGRKGIGESAAVTPNPRKFLKVCVLVREARFHGFSVRLHPQTWSGNDGWNALAGDGGRGSFVVNIFGANELIWYSYADLFSGRQLPGTIEYRRKGQGKRLGPSIVYVSPPG
jgi:hypothetical protein